MKLVLFLYLYIISSNTQSPVVCTTNNNCGDDYYCHTETCSTGYCLEIPIECEKEFIPVCGCDGNTYGNNCTAHAAGVSISHTGPCLSIPVCNDCVDNYMALNHINNVMNNWQSGLSMNVRLLIQGVDLFLLIDLIDQVFCDTEQELTIRQLLRSTIVQSLPNIDESAIVLNAIPDSEQCVYLLFIDICPIDKPKVECLVDPCFRNATQQCPNYPNSICVSDYCGGCNALFFENTNGILHRVPCFKPGGCPTVNENNENCDNTAECYSDYDCNGSMKCCNNECGGRLCVNADPSQATCNEGPCCDTSTKKPLKATICRSTNGRCDVPDICDGISPYCPADKYLPFGSTCKLNSNTQTGICLGNHHDACMPGKRIPKYH